MNFIDLNAQQERIKEKIDANIQKVLVHGRYIMGPEIKELENKLALFSGVSYAVGCASGTDALLMVLMAYGIGRGDAVFTTPFTFIATAEVISLLGATPIFVDVDPKTFNINADKLKQTIETVKNEGKLKSSCIIPVDIFGQPADYNEINAIAKEEGLFVLEDAAQSFGSEYQGKKACSLAHTATTSFFPAKPLGCYGDGGMIFTDDEDIYDKLVSIRVHGKGKDKYDNVRIGLNGRLDTIQAAILLAKFEIFEEEIGLRQTVADRYNKGLKDICEVPYVKEGNLSAWAQYSVLHPEKNKIINHLKENVIPTAVYYITPLHLLKAYESLKYIEGDFPVCENISKNIFSLPMHPYLKEEDQNIVIKKFKEIV